MNLLLLLLAPMGLLLTGNPAAHTSPQKPSAAYKLGVREPSDLCFTADGNGFWIVGDEGQLSRTDLTGAIQQTSPQDGLDYEGVFCAKGEVLVMEEVTRNILHFETQSLTQKGISTLQYAGGHNKAFESLTWNPVRKTYVTVTEKEPVLLWELDEKFQPVNQVKLDFASDISAATFARGDLWLLSDEEATLFRLDPETLVMKESWRTGIYNPEGLAISEDGIVYIVSDDVATLYVFNQMVK